MSPSDLKLDPDVELTIMTASQQAAPREACGLLYVTFCLVMNNVSPDPRYFAMDDYDLMAAYDTYGAPVAVWHSHPEGPLEPSPADWQFLPPGCAMIICDLKEVRVWPSSSRPS